MKPKVIRAILIHSNFNHNMRYISTGKSHTLEKINLSFVNASRLAGIGNTPARRMCTFFNINNPPSDWGKYQTVLHECFQKRAQWSMQRAVQEAVDQSVVSRGSSELTASFDGSWMKRYGHNSKAGITTCVSAFTNKIIDVDVRHKYCQMCKGKTQCKHGEHCGINYDGSSGGMETTGAITIVQRIHQKYGVKITEYLSDGDSRAFAKTKAAIQWAIEKLECKNHLAKRMGARLRRRKAEMKGLKIVDIGKRKGIGGPGWQIGRASCRERV